LVGEKGSVMKRRTYIGILVALLCFVGATVVPRNGYNQEVLQVSIEEAIDLALRKSEDLQIAENDIEKMRYAYKEARSTIYPHIEGEITWAHYPEYPPAAAATTKDYSLGTGVTVNQVLWAFGRVSSAIRLADKYIAISGFNKDIARQEVAYNTKLSYYSALLAERTLSIVTESYENARKNKSLLEKRTSSGRSSKADNIKVAADIASRIPEVNNARATFDSAMRTLKILIGVDQSAPIALTDGFATHHRTFEVGGMKESLQENEPTLQALRKQIEADKDMIKLRRANFLPIISAFATWDYKGIGDTYEVRRDNLNHYVVAGLKVSVPIWAGGEKIAQLNQAKINKENDILQLQKTTKELGLKLENAVSEYHAYIDTLEANTKAVELAQESFKMIQDLFETGQVSLADLNDGELQLTNQRLSMMLTLYNINTTAAEIEKLAATELRK
jgi:outer membrane protein